MRIRDNDDVNFNDKNNDYHKFVEGYLDELEQKQNRLQEKRGDRHQSEYPGDNVSIEKLSDNVARRLFGFDTQDAEGIDFLAFRITAGEGDLSVAQAAEMVRDMVGSNDFFYVDNENDGVLYLKNNEIKYVKRSFNLPTDVIVAYATLRGGIIKFDRDTNVTFDGDVAYRYGGN